MMRPACVDNPMVERDREAAPSELTKDSTTKRWGFILFRSRVEQGKELQYDCSLSPRANEAKGPEKRTLKE